MRFIISVRCGNERQRIFRDERDQAQLIELLERSRARYEMAVLAFMLMGNHFIWLRRRTALI
jgi:REP element-mobilizing transposase RayT